MAARAGVLVFVLTLAADASAAVERLQELIDRTSGSVAHLSIRDAGGKERSSGSGFVVSEGGRLATNFHVVDGAERIVAVFPGGREVAVQGAWNFHVDDDVAVLQLAPGKYRPLALSKSPARAGDDVVVIGSPMGLGHSVSTGIVAALRDRGTITRRHEDGFANWGLQITAAIAPGSSGSPVLNGQGEVIGVAVGQMGFGALHFAVPAAKLEAVLAAEKPVLTPLRGVRQRDVLTNLLISAGLFAGVAIVGWLVAWWNRRAARRTGWVR